MNQPTSSKRHLIIGWLIIAHVVGGFIFSQFAVHGGELAKMNFAAFLFCEASLMGIWGGLGPSHWMLRTVGVVLLPVPLTFALTIGMGGPMDENFFLLATVTWGVALTSLGLRLLGARLRRSEGGASSRRQVIRFTIWQMMMLTLVVACLLMFGKSIQPYVLKRFIVMATVAFGVGTTIVALGALWAVLRPKLRARWLVTILVISIAEGWGIGLLLRSNPDLHLVVFTALQSVYLMASLYVFRIAGYRLVSYRHYEPGHETAVDANSME